MSGIRLFLRAQLAAAVGTLADVVAFQLLVVATDLAPTGAVAASASVGAIINFGLARHWVFRVGDGSLRRQATLFLLGALLSIVLNTLLVHLGTVTLSWPPLPVRLAAILLVAAGFNYPFQRRVVFRHGALGG
ncbi:MAG: GtrA family protein [Pseudomonadota bacterium]